MSRLWREAIRDGVVPPPPAAQLLDLTLEEVADGRTLFGFEPHARFLNGMGAVHGGILATVADFAVSTAAVTLVPEGSAVATASLTIGYLRPVTLATGRATCEGRVVHLGRSLAHVEATMRDADGRVLLTATATCHVRPAGDSAADARAAA